MKHTFNHLCQGGIFISFSNLLLLKTVHTYIVLIYIKSSVFTFVSAFFTAWVQTTLRQDIVLQEQCQ